MRNNVPCKIACIGIVEIRMFDEIIRTLTDIRHIPKLKKNLISLNSLYSK